jgi:hypothetical protein
MKELVVTRKVFSNEAKREIIVTYEGFKGELVLEIRPINQKDYKYVTEVKDKAQEYEGFKLVDVNSTLVDEDDENLAFLYNILERVGKEDFEEVSPSGDTIFKAEGNKLYSNRL